MREMILRALSDLDNNSEPLEMADLPVPVPGAGEVRIRGAKVLRIAVA